MASRKWICSARLVPRRVLLLRLLLPPALLGEIWTRRNQQFERLPSLFHREHSRALCLLKSEKKTEDSFFMRLCETQADVSQSHISTPSRGERSCVDECVQVLCTCGRTMHCSCSPSDAPCNHTPNWQKHALGKAPDTLIVWLLIHLNAGNCVGKHARACKKLPGQASGKGFIQTRWVLPALGA